MSRLVIGLVGGIASGKSTVARLWALETAAVHVDADAIAREVLGRREVLAALRRRIKGLGKGRIDRQMLAEKVFKDPRALKALEEVTHPRIREAIVLAIGRAKARHVLLDAALLQETGADELCDAVVYVACPARKRRARTRRTRGWTDAHHRAREARQWSCMRKRARADLSIDNSDGQERTRSEVRRLIARLGPRTKR
ncbi:MAG: dephospho-CoA kinase [Planctomycetes bacterium]|nr:dephospho-CoA kinase [Planctomycetota bacterium]